jgi:hypothetical protein
MRAPDGALWVSRCAAAKNVLRGTPRQLYGSPLLDCFFRFVDATHLGHAILSDRYGLHFSDEYLKWYDVHPSSLSAGDKHELGRVIRVKALKRGYTSIVFYNGSPVRSVPYFEMLAASRLSVWYTTRLPDVSADSESRLGV